MNWYLELLDKIYNAQRVIAKLDEKREIFEAFVLKIHAIWEVFVGELLVDCLNKDSPFYLFDSPQASFCLEILTIRAFQIKMFNIIYL